MIQVFGIIDVGGGTRGVYSSGIYDAFMDNNFYADYCLAVSAGAPNLITYVARQRGRMFKFFYEYFQREESLGLKNFLKTGSFVSLDYLYSTLSNEGGENPLDIHTALVSETRYKLVISKMKDGTPVYIDKNDFTVNDYVYLKASCSLPVACRPVKIGEDFYCDGGIADQFPYKKAFADGCNKLLIVLTKPREEYLKKIRFLWGLKIILYRYPELFDKIKKAHDSNKEALEEIEILEKEGRVVVLEPENRFGMKTLTVKKSALEKMYRQGYEDGLNFLKNNIEANGLMNKKRFI